MVLTPEPPGQRCLRRTRVVDCEGQRAGNKDGMVPRVSAWELRSSGQNQSVVLGMVEPALETTSTENEAAIKFLPKGRSSYPFLYSKGGRVGFQYDQNKPQ